MTTLRFLLSLVVKVNTWVNDLDELLERKFEEWTAYRSPKRKTVQLEGLKAFEERIVPANIDLWVGPANGNFNAGANWSIMDNKEFLRMETPCSSAAVSTASTGR